jgi:hypothetical protein
MIAAMKREYLERFPRGEFIVLLLPKIGNFGADGDSWVLIPYLEEAGISYLDYTGYNLDQLMGGSAHFLNDSHPTPDAVKYLAAQVFADVNAYLGHRQTGLQGSVALDSGSRAR